MDDDSEFIDKAKHFLEKKENDLEVETLDSPIEALREIRENSYDAIFSEYRMSDMDGLEFLKTLREKGLDTIFVLLLENNDDEVINKALNFGADFCMRKDGDSQFKYDIMSQVAKFQEKHKKKFDLLSSKEEKYRRLFETSKEGIMILDAETGKILEVNQAFENLLGYEEKDILGKELWEIGKEEEIRKNILRIKIIEEEGSEEFDEVKLETKHGDEIIVELLGNVYEKENEKLIQCHIKEVTKEKEAEEKEEFLHSLLRHDLLNKLQVISFYNEFMREQSVSEEQEETIQKSERAVHDCINLIEKVRKIRKVGREEIEPVNLNIIIDQVIDQEEHEASEKGMEIERDRVKNEVKSGYLVQEIFSNLIENAIRHSGGSKIKISSWEENGEVVVSVEDDGIGVPDKIKNKIFKRGYKDLETAGSGLGLYLVKELVDSYGGSVEVKDSEMGGARFDVHLRKA